MGGHVVSAALPSGRSVAISWVSMLGAPWMIEQSLRSVGMTNKIRQIIESGPPDALAENFERLLRSRVRETKEAAIAANKALGWESLLSSLRG